MKTRLLFACAPSLLAFFAMSCSSPDFCVGAACGTVDGGDDDGGGGGDGGKDAAGDATVHDGGADADAMGQGDTSPPGCNTSADIAPQSACVTDGNGIFVNGMTGSDLTGSGTKESAFKSIGKAIGVSSSGGRVFICATTYQEPVKLTSNVSLYGGFDCTGWAYSTSNMTKVAPSAVGYALDLESVSGVTIEDLDFDSVAGVNPGESSIAIFANGSTATLRRVSATAGDAGPAPGTGKAGLNYSNGSSAPVGYAGDGGITGPVQTCPMCADGDVSKGGQGGGSGTTGGLPGGDGLPTLTPMPTGTTPPHDGIHGAGAPDTVNACKPGDPGAFSPAVSGGAGAAKLGALSATGWQPMAGSPGGTAAVAQGGGGGGGGVGTSNGAGGGGGCGGCGGGAGAGGAGGGSSFAVLSFNATLTFDDCALTSATASNGGPGGDGQQGQSGGFGGTQSAPGCPGGMGGSGANGGGGGGGAGGVSIGVGYIGPAPNVMSNCTTSFSSTTTAGGSAGANGSPDAGAGRAGTNSAALDLSK